MTVAAARDDPYLMVWDGEIRRGGLSYSIDTVRELKKAFDLDERPGLILGDDLLAGFHEWRDADVLSREARLVCARREHADRVDFPYEHVYLDNLLIPVSSRMIRERRAAGLPCRRLVADAVWRIMEDKGYYGRGGEQRGPAESEPALGPLSEDSDIMRDDDLDGLAVRIEAAVRKALSPKRIDHSRGCAVFASEACSCAGLDPRQGPGCRLGA